MPCPSHAAALRAGAPSTCTDHRRTPFRQRLRPRRRASAPLRRRYAADAALAARRATRHTPRSVRGIKRHDRRRTLASSSPPSTRARGERATTTETALLDRLVTPPETATVRASASALVAQFARWPPAPATWRPCPRRRRRRGGAALSAARRPAKFGPGSAAAMIAPPRRPARLRAAGAARDASTTHLRRRPGALHASHSRRRCSDEHKWLHRGRAAAGGSSMLLTRWDTSARAPARPQTRPRS